MNFAKFLRARLLQNTSGGCFCPELLNVSNINLKFNIIVHGVKDANKEKGVFPHISKWCSYFKGYNKGTGEFISLMEVESLVTVQTVIFGNSNIEND